MKEWSLGEKSNEEYLIETILDQDFVKYYDTGTPWKGVWLKCSQFFYRENKEMLQHPWVIYYDMRFENFIKRWRSKRNNVEE